MLFCPALFTRSALEISLFNTVLLDAATWLLCLIALLSFARLSMSHPATTYLAFHGLLISTRGIAILNGATTLFSWRGAAPVTFHEISRAMILADLALAAMTCAWIIAAHQGAKSVGKPKTARRLRVGIVQVVATVGIPTGCAAMLLWGRLPGIAPHNVGSAWAASSWVVIAQTWAGLSLLALIYWYGFKATLILPAALYLAFVVYQGYDRFRLLIPLVLLTQIYLDRRGRRWPRLSGALLIIAGGLIFFPLKGIGQELQAGESVGNVWHSALRGIGDALRGNHPDQMILDEFAATLTLADNHGKLYFGSTYVGLLTVVVPRQWWPEKPGLADFEKEISTPDRPFAEDGMVVTMLGEFYLNFSYVGIVVMSFAVAFFTGKWFYAAYRYSYFTLNRFMYLLVACNLIQVFRDGLISLFVFVIINMMPLSAIALIHLLYRSNERAICREPILKTPRVRQFSDREPVA